MSTLAVEALGDGSLASTARRRLNPTLCYWIAGLIAYGGAALHFANGHFLDQTSRDLWQHLASLRALIQDPANPANPFIPAGEASRHFHPYWVSVAWIARLVGWNEWQAIGFAGFFSAGVLLGGIYAFGRAFYRDPWGPFALLAAMIFAWLVPTSHTGYHSMGTLIEGIAYPAVLLIGLSFWLWTITIRALDDARWSLVIAPFTAIMFATHQLGAGIGFIGASCFIFFSADGSLKNRAYSVVAMAVGLAASSLWPYFNPFGAVLTTGNVQWHGEVSYYGLKQLMAATVPQALGLLGLLSTDFARRARPVLAALIIFSLLFACGLFGVMIATRFVMPAVLMLHIGLGAGLIVLARRWHGYSDRKQLSIFGAGLMLIIFSQYLNYVYLSHEAGKFAERGNVYEAARKLTADVPDMEPVAGYDVGVWPVVATGQRAISIPWPEPGISDLAERQHLVERLFDPRLSREQRVLLARSVGVRVLIMDNEGPLRRDAPPQMAETLERQSVRRSTAGPYVRFDLY